MWIDFPLSVINNNCQRANVYFKVPHIDNICYVIRIMCENISVNVFRLA